MGFSLKSNQKNAVKRWEDERSCLLAVSPPCIRFNTRQNLTLETRDAEAVRKQFQEAAKHLAFAAYMCLKQAVESSKFAFENPVAASSWQLALVNQLFRDGAEHVSFHFCALGMTIGENGVPTLVKKRTAVVTNSKILADALTAASSWTMAPARASITAWQSRQ